jgi:hypothetical protein
VESNSVRALGRRAEDVLGRPARPDAATVGTGTIEEYFAFGRDIALLDTMCHQANDFQVTEEEWQRLRGRSTDSMPTALRDLRRATSGPGMTPGGGDRNVMFRSDLASLHRSSHAEVDDMADARPTASRSPSSSSSSRARRRAAHPHIGGRYADIVGFHDPRWSRSVEIYSDWGRFEWLLEDALKAGYNVGVVANSDGHKGRPGASHPGASQFGAYGGLTCVLADALTREAVFDALKARRCYGVTAAQRIHVELAVNGLPMGAEGRARGPVRHHGRVAGTGPLERVDVFRGLRHCRRSSPTPRARSRAAGAIASRGPARACAGATG